MRLFVFYGDMLGNTENNGVWRYTFELRKRRNFFAKMQTKVQKTVWKEENVVVTKLSSHKLNKHKQE